MKIEPTLVFESAEDNKCGVFTVRNTGESYCDACFNNVNHHWVPEEYLEFIHVAENFCKANKTIGDLRKFADKQCEKMSKGYDSPHKCYFTGERLVYQLIIQPSGQLEFTAYTK